MFILMHFTRRTSASSSPVACSPSSVAGGFSRRRPSPLGKRLGRDPHPLAKLVHVRLQHRWPGPVVHELPVPTRLHQTGACELLEVVGDRGLPHRKAAAEATTADFGLLRDVLQDLDPAGIGQRLGDALELLSVHGLPYPLATVTIHR